MVIFSSENIQYHISENLKHEKPYTVLCGMLNVKPTDIYVVSDYYIASMPREFFCETCYKIHLENVILHNLGEDL